jgi:hypothetical protein
MKKLLIVFILVASIMVLNALLEPGLNITFGLVNSSMNLDVEGMPLTTDSNTGINFCISLINYDTDRAIIIEPGIRFAQRGYTQNLVFPPDFMMGLLDDDMRLVMKEEIKSNHLDLFVRAKLNVDRNFGNRFPIYLYPYVGIAGTMLLSANVDYSTELTYEGATYRDKGSEGAMHLFNEFGVLAVAGLDVLVNDKMTIGFEWNRTMTNILENVTDPVFGAIKTTGHYNTLILNVGYALRF